MTIQFAGKVLGREPESRYTPAGDPLLTFSVALYTGGNKTEGYKPSVWVSVEAWGPLAETWRDTLVKGMTVTVKGLAKPPRTYVDREGNERPAGLEVRAQDIQPFDIWRPDALHPGMESEYPEPNDGIPF